MRTIIGTRVHEEIVGLIDRARSGLVLVSPFVRAWPELRRALARAVARGVGLRLVTRAGDGPSERELLLFEELEASVVEVPRLHAKAYLSDQEALYTSANLTRESVERAVESAMLFDRADAGWNDVFEIWQRVLDDTARAGQGPAIDAARVLTLPLRQRADQGDEDAREKHRYCIACGETASQEAEQVVCVRCRAAAIAEDRDPETVIGTRCTRCNCAQRRTRVDRPYCDACYRSEDAPYARHPPRWFVTGRFGAIEAWSTAAEMLDEGVFARAASEALGRRWSTHLPPGAG